MPLKVDVLNGGFVRLVSYMQPAVRGDMLAKAGDFDHIEGADPELCANWTGDLEIVRNARVSYDADWRTGEDEGKDEKLINYLYANKHTSPFEAMAFTFEVKAPIFVFRQWHRHRTWSYNELSARYATLDEGFYLPDPDKIGKQSDSHKQMRDFKDEFAPEHKARIVADLEQAYKDAFAVYTEMLRVGVPRELARSVLPVAAYSRMFATVDLHNLFHFLRLRLHPHAQYEIRVYAEAILGLIRPIVPVAVAAFEASMMSDEERKRRGIR